MHPPRMVEDRGALLVGRADEIADLEHRVARVRDGVGAAVLLEGEAGVGKSRLVRRVRDLADREHVRVLDGAAHEMTVDRPFGVLLELVAGGDPPLGGFAEVRRLLTEEPEAGDADAPSLRFRIVDAVVDAVRTACTARPLVITVEDVHWADAASLLALQAVAQATGELPCLLVLTRRPYPQPEALLRFVAAVEDAGGVRRGVGPLDDGTVADLLARLLGAPPGPRLEQHAHRAGGNPLFVGELVAGLLAEGAIELRDGRAELLDATLPGSLRSVVLRRVRSLPSATRAMLREAAVLGSAFRVVDLAAVVDVGPAEVAGRLQPAFEAGFLVDDGSRAAFRHALVHESIYLDIAGPVRAALHVRAGRRLAAAGATADVVAHHLSRGASPGDDEAVRWLCRAAREAAPRAPAIAVGLIRRALDLAPADHPGRDEMRAALARDLLWSGRFDEAELEAGALLADARSPDLAAGLRYVLARTLAYRGRIGDSLRQVDAALRAGVDDPRRHARLVADLALRRGLHGDLDGAEVAARRALTLGEEQHDALTVTTAHCALAWDASLRAEPDAALGHARRAVRPPGAATDDVVEPVQARLYLAFALAHADRLDEAEEVLRSGLHLTRDLGTGWAPPLYRTLRALTRWWAGDWDGAAGDAAEAAAEAEATGARVWRPLADVVSAHVAVCRGEPVAAHRTFDRATADVDAAGGTHVAQALLGWVGAHLAAADGDVPEVHDRLRRAWRAAIDYGAVVHLPVIGPDLVRSCLARGDDGSARDVTERIRRIAAVSGTPGAEAAALRCRGLVDADPLALVAAAELVADRRPHEAALAAGEAAIALMRAGDSGRARPLAEQAVEVHERLGAVRDRDALLGRLRELGLRRGARGRRDGATHGWASLTPAELRVVRLVAEGLSNPDVAARLFISRRTVESHVSKALGKLGVASRVELALQATAHLEGEVP